MWISKVYTRIIQNVRALTLKFIICGKYVTTKRCEYPTFHFGLSQEIPRSNYPPQKFFPVITPSWVIALLPAFFFYLFIPQARYKNFKLIY